jgi:hypothetical protein
VDPRGLCTDQTSGSCGNNGLCNGTGGCQKYGAGTICAPASCSGFTLSAARTCDGAGACQPAATMPCPNGFACNTSSNVCFASCSVATDCAPNFTCKNSGKCK